MKAIAKSRNYIFGLNWVIVEGRTLIRRVGPISITVEEAKCTYSDDDAIMKNDDQLKELVVRYIFGKVPAACSFLVRPL